jgi:hypothetical protein
VYQGDHRDHQSGFDEHRPARASIRDGVLSGHDSPNSSCLRYLRSQVAAPSPQAVSHDATVSQPPTRPIPPSPVKPQR